MGIEIYLVERDDSEKWGYRLNSEWAEKYCIGFNQKTGRKLFRGIDKDFDDVGNVTFNEIVQMADWLEEGLSGPTKQLNPPPRS